jgi:HEPN domain-containing protein
LCGAKDLIVYKKAYALAIEIFRLSKGWLPEGNYSLTDQIQRCPRSVCTNSREAWAKRGRKSRQFTTALFFGHLAVEKLLKALYAQERNDHAPPTHNLQRLAVACGLPLDEGRTDVLLAITEFNLEARYPDLKRTFRVRCTQDYAQAQMTRIRETSAWPRSRLM